jgi:virulence-associated protein VagC
MKTGKLFRVGYQQAVRLPKEVRLPCGDIEIVRRGRELILRTKLNGGRRRKNAASVPRGR